MGESSDGRMNAEVTRNFFRNILVPWLNERRKLPFILFVDQLRAHVTSDTADMCAHQGLFIHTLFANSAQVRSPYRPLLGAVVERWPARAHGLIHRR